MALENNQSGTEVAQSGTEKRVRLGKSHQDYWHSKLKKRSYKWNGKTLIVPEWQVRIGHLDGREWFNTGTANKAAAAVKARDVYLSLIGSGWKATLAKIQARPTR